ncbi:hypothetical protein PLICRDRAFT_169471 [Plicaturopsis crispa FD-325 SS-3]|nr:hypothetical protein PLICRDRAFT_169471 [Plicaturopsis crispa FD-325 SS-3]
MGGSSSSSVTDLAPSTRLFLRGIPEDVEIQQVYEHLVVYGRIQEVKLMPEYGFVEFESQKDATDAVEMLRRQKFLGADVEVQYARPLRKNMAVSSSNNASTAARRQTQRTERGHLVKYPVQVLGMSCETKWQELKDFGRSSGSYVAFCDLDRNKPGRGFIEYLSQEDADNAVRHLDDTLLGGNIVKVNLRNPKTYDVPYVKDQHAPRHVFHADSRSRSRSRSPARGRMYQARRPRSPDPVRRSEKGKAQSSRYHHHHHHPPRTTSPTMAVPMSRR